MRLLLLALILSLTACVKETTTVKALVPEYFDPLDFSEIRTLDPQEVVDKGTFFQQDGYLFVNDRKKGIHVIDNSIPGNPQYIYFWNIPGNSTFTLDAAYLYADNGPHLLVIDISDFGNIKFERYIEGIFYENMREQFPREAFSGQLFECPDPEKGLVKRWREETREKPNCERI